MGRRLFACLVVLGLLTGGFALAQERSYDYDSIKVTAQVNQDSTVDIEERQVFDYRGTYHNGWRSIPLNKISAVSDVQVIDGATGEAVESKVSRGDGAVNIRWTYDLADTRHEWILRYKVHGALGFYDNLDEFYWNLFTAYDVPVELAEITVKLPENQFATGELKIAGYGEPVAPAAVEVLDNRTFHLLAYNLPAGEKLTIAAGWPRGLVDRAAFWQWWLWHNLLYFLSAILVLGVLAYSLMRWYLLEYRPLHSRTVVPEYAPPRELCPAAMELVARERISGRTWGATIVDLAVRGYLKIEETEKRTWFWTGKDFQLTKTPKVAAGGLANFESELLAAIFGTENPITLSRLRKRNESATAGSKFRSQLLELKKSLLHETENLTGAYAVPLTAESKKVWIFVIPFFLAFLVGVTASFAAPSILIFIIALVFAVVWRLFFDRYEARLSPEGMQLKREILGFKLYLETAERYRLQNLTPDLFEKFLPYAMIFGVEKKWAKAFEGMEVPPPTWYAGGMVHGSSISGSNFSSGFSASAFSSSFASSFSSAFSSSSGGASGGGGGAGGGGGGGGGGAS